MSERTVSIKERILFGLSGFPDQLTYQAFTIYVFTFYFAVVGLTIGEMWTGFVIWAIWNMFNDPLLGTLSEKTKQKGKLGKRKFYLIISFVPLSLIMIFLFTTPSNFKFWYFLIIIFTFELFYTMFSVNTNAIFPEMFPTQKQRADVNVFIKIFTLIAIILASLLPTLIIKPLVPLTYPPDPLEAAAIQFNYIISGIILGSIVLIMAILFIFFGVNEKEETAIDHAKRPGFFKSLKITFSNRTFLKFTFGNMLIWYCLNILLTGFPLFSVFVLGRTQDSFFIGVTLAITLISAAIFIPLQSWIASKYGTRRGLIFGLAMWIVSLFPLVFLSNNEISRILSMVIFFAAGYGLSAALFYIDLIHGDVIDQDALKFGVKRAASYYGVNAFIHRFSIILVISTIAIVFTGTGWSSYTPIPSNPFLIELGLKSIMFLFPSIALVGSILFWKFFDLHGEKLRLMREELEKHPELQ